MQRGVGVCDAVYVVRFCIGGGAFDCDQLERAEFWEDEDEAGEGVGADAGFAAVELPVVFGGDFCGLLADFGGFGSVEVGGLVFAMQECYGVGDARDEGSGGEAIGAHIEAAASCGGEVFCEAVGLVVGER